MKDEIVKLSKKNGFVSNIDIVHEAYMVSDGNIIKKLLYYLWLCELQKWLREEHKIELWVGRDSVYNEYKCTGDLDDSREVVATYFHKTYEEALEKGLEEALKLI